MTSEQPLVLLEHARKSFGGTPVLKDISLSVRRGEVVAVIGPSGGGKSTRLRCRTLLETLDAGRLAYGDLVVAESDGAGAAAYAPKAVLKEAKTRFGLVFQNFNLFPHYSVLKNITDAPLHVQKRPKDEVLGYSKFQTFMKIVLPQVVKRILPAMSNEIITLVKDTSLAFVLGIMEMFSQAKAIAASQVSMLPYVIAGVIYWVFNFIVEIILTRVEKRLNYYHD